MALLFGLIALTLKIGDWTNDIPGSCLRRCKEEVNWDAVRKEIVKILDDDTYKESNE